MMTTDIEGTVAALERNDPNLTQLDLLRVITNIDQLDGFNRIMRALGNNTVVVKIVNVPAFILRSEEGKAVFIETMSHQKYVKALEFGYQHQDINACSILNEILEFNRTLESISLKCSRLVGSSFRRMVRKFPDINLLNLDLTNSYMIRKNYDILARYVGQSKTLQTLILDGCPNYRESLGSILRAVQKTNTVRYLGISAGPFAEAGKDVLKFLRKNPAVESLNLGRKPDMDPNFIRGLVRILRTKKNTNLRQLRMHNNSLTSAHVRPLIEFLGQPESNLEFLDLSSNRLDDEFAADLKTCLSQNSRLKVLNISNNLISNVGADMISEGLRLNNQLTSLNVGNNRIYDKGIVSIFNMLAVNTCLQELSIYQDFHAPFYCIGTNPCIEALSVALETNKSLKILNILSVLITSVDMVAFSRALKLNKGLEVLYINVMKMFSSRDCDYLVDEIQSHNNSLVEIYMSNTEKLTCSPKLTDFLGRNRHNMRLRGRGLALTLAALG